MKHVHPITGLFSLLCAAFLFQSPASAALGHERPNIVLIYADDLGYGGLSAYGAETIKTPRIDALAREGALFTDAHSPAAVCSPSRYALLTGRYCWRTSLKRRVLAPQAPHHIETGRETIASYLKSKGYRTGIVGKWHLGLGAPPETDWNNEPIEPGPLAAGFDYSFIIPGSNNFPPSVYIENGRVVDREAGERIELSVRPDGSGTPGWKLHEKRTIRKTWDAERMGLRLAGKAVDFIEAHAAEPFFLYFPAPQPHLPLTPNDRFQGSSDAGAYGDFIRELDWMTGEVLDALDRTGTARHTLVIFTSDNGGVLRLGARHGLAVNGPLRGQKGQIHEGGHRVPFILRWPEVVAPDSVNPSLFDQVDLYASIHALFGDTVPAGNGEDSRNQLEVLLGKAETPEDLPVIHHSSLGMFALRLGPWKYVQGQGPGGNYAPGDLRRIRQLPDRQLYNLDDDLAETRNIASDHPELVEHLDAELEAIKARGHNQRRIPIAPASQNPVSHNKPPASRTPYPAPHIPHPASHIPYPISRIPYPEPRIPNDS